MFIHVELTTRPAASAIPVQRPPNSTGSKVAGLAAGGAIVAVFAIVAFFILALVVMGLAFHAAGCATGASCI